MGSYTNPLKKFLKIPSHKTHKTTSTYAKIYPGLTRIYKFTSEQSYLQSGFEPTKPQKTKLKSSAQQSALDNLRSIRRTRTTIEDIILSNQFDYFITFTFKADRQNVDKQKQKMKNWLKNHQRKHGKLKYIIVPEFHKDGQSIHFHALMSGNLQLKDSGKFINGRKAYNLTNYKLGFTTAIKIDNTIKVASYVKKYITKDMPLFQNKKRYWCSSKLQRPQILKLDIWTNNPFLDLSPTYVTPHLEMYEINTTINSSINQEIHSWITPRNTLSSSKKQLSLKALVKNQEDPI